MTNYTWFSSERRRLGVIPKCNPKSSSRSLSFSSSSPLPRDKPLEPPVNANIQVALEYQIGQSTRHIQMQAPPKQPPRPTYVADHKEQ